MNHKRYEELTFTDDFMFCKVLANNEELCKELLELILGIKIRKVVVLNRQQAIEITADAKGVRLDVYVEDDENSVYDIEMEATKRIHLPKRSRYYQAMIDLNIIERGEKYDKLKKSFVIFICLKDPFDRGMHLYSFENRCKEIPELLLGDETIKVFVNAAGTANDVSPEMADFLKYLVEGVGDSPLVNKIDAAVQNARAHAEWRSEYMSLLLRDLEMKEEGREEGRLQQLFELVQEGDISLEVALKRTTLSEKEFVDQMKQYVEKK